MGHRYTDTTAAIEARTIHDPKARYRMRGVYISDYMWKPWRDLIDAEGVGVSEAIRTMICEYMAARGVDVAEILRAEEEAR